MIIDWSLNDSIYICERKPAQLKFTLFNDQLQPRFFNNEFYIKINHQYTPLSVNWGSGVGVSFKVGYLQSECLSEYLIRAKMYHKDNIYRQFIPILGWPVRKELDKRISSVNRWNGVNNSEFNVAISQSYCKKPLSPIISKIDLNNLDWSFQSNNPTNES